VAVLLGFVSLRSRGPSFVIITVAFLFLVQVIAVNWVSVTNGTAGLTLPLPSWDRDIINWPFYYALVAILAMQLVMTWWIRRTKLGMGLIAIREDETKAATIGINLPVEKILAFVASTVFVGMAGAVYGYYLTFIDPRGMFGILISVQLILSLLLGGKATLWGPVIGAFLIEPMNEIANNNLGGGNSRLFLFGGLLVLVVIFLPKGILPAIESMLYRRRTAGRAGLVGARIGTGGSLASITDRIQKVERPAEPRPLLEVRGLTKHFGGLKAVDGCSFVVPDGTITGLIGPNGSGKTTVFNLIDNTISADAGEIVFDGERIDKLPSWARAHRGLGRTFQITRLFGEMTVLENVVAAQSSFSLGQLARIAVSGKEAEAAEELLEFVGMRAFRDQKAQALSYGQQKLVEFAQILMLDPRLILLDEPAGGINPVLIERMGEMIRELNSYGKTFLIVEHNMPFVLDLCDPIHVLARGATMASGTPEQIQTDPAVIDAYLGADFTLDQGAVS
jgi:branched-chain amino acid transport system permease protein